MKNTILETETNSKSLIFTPEQLNFYHEKGYLLPQKKLFPENEFKDLQNLFSELHNDWIKKGGQPEAMNCPHFYEPKLMKYLLHQSVLDVVQQIIGENILLFASHFICKPAGTGLRVPWHEDSAYWKGQWDPMEVVTVWLALDKSDLENGCMQVIPGSHQNGYSNYSNINEKAVFNTEINSGQFNESTAVPCILEPNQFSLHHAKMIHGSGKNTSNRRRCGYTMRYISASAKRTSSSDTFQIYLARGKNIANNEVSDPTKVNQKWLDKYGVLAPKGH